MDKKLRLSITYVVLLSILIGSAILISKPTDKSIENKNSVNVNKTNDFGKGDLSQDINAYKNQVIDSNNFIKKETINIFNNVNNIDLHANLAENMNGQVSLILTYKSNGKLTTKNIDSSSITEIRNIFRFREEYGSGFKLKNMFLNKKVDKLYFCVEGKPLDRFTQTTVYSYSLKNSEIKKIFFDMGIFSNFSVSPDGKYNAFSYLSCPQNITHNEKTIVLIIRCSDNKLVLNSSEEIANRFEKNNDLYVYSYNFIKWQSSSICQLRQRIKTKDGSQKVEEQNIFYNVLSKRMSDKIE